MTLNSCSEMPEPSTAPDMDGTEWQIRAKAAGLSQRMLARLVDRPENTISRQLRGEFGKAPGDLVAIIIAWEDMAPVERTDWAARVEAALAARVDPRD